MVVALVGQQYNVGEKPTVVSYAYINRHAGTPKKAEAKDAMSLGRAQFCYIGSRIGWVSALQHAGVIQNAVCHIQRNGCQPEKTNLVDWLIESSRELIKKIQPVIRKEKVKRTPHI